MAGDATTTSPGEDDWAMAAARELCERYVVKYADVPLLMAPQPWEYELADVIRRHAPKGSDQLAAARAALGLPDGADVAEGVWAMKADGDALADRVRFRDAELLRCRTAENHAAATLDAIRAELRLPVGCPLVDILNGVIGLEADRDRLADDCVRMADAVQERCAEEADRHTGRPGGIIVFREIDVVETDGRAIAKAIASSIRSLDFHAFSPPPPPVEVGADDDGEGGNG